METKFKIGDVVCEKNNLPKWRKRHMMIKSISRTELITCYVFPPKFSDAEMIERDFADWQLEKINE